MMYTSSDLNLVTNHNNNPPAIVAAANSYPPGGHSHISELWRPERRTVASLSTTVVFVDNSHFKTNVSLEALARRKAEHPSGASQTGAVFSIDDPRLPSDITSYLSGRAHTEVRPRLLDKFRTDVSGESIRMLLFQATTNKGSNALDFAIDLLAGAGNALCCFANRRSQDVPQSAWYIIAGAVARSDLNLETKETLLQRWMAADSTLIRDAVVHALGALVYYFPAAASSREALRQLAVSDPDPSIREAALIQLDDLM